MSWTPPPARWHREQIKKYSKDRNRLSLTEHDTFVLYANVLRAVLRRACDRYVPLGIVQARAKSVSSFAEKVVRKWPARRDPINEFTDLCGARVITPTQQEVQPLGSFVKNRFHILEDEDVAGRLGSSEFGYRSYHFVVQLRPDTLDGLDLPPELGKPDKIQMAIGQRKAEIQIRTLMEHAWADVMHDRLYKTELTVPESWKHRAARQAALLESADQEFSHIVADLDSYLVHHSAYMTKEKMDGELETLGVILENEAIPDRRAELAVRFARIARERSSWTSVVEVLAPFLERNLRDPELHRNILLEYGYALCQVHRDRVRGARYREGQRWLEKAAVSDPGDWRSGSADRIRAMALALLAETLREQQGTDLRVLQLFQEASTLDPGDPYYLASALEQEVICEHGFRTLRSRASQIRSAMDTCRQHVSLGIDPPRAFLALGRYNVFLEQCEEAMEMYAKATAGSDDIQAIDMELARIARIQGSFLPDGARSKKSTPGPLDCTLRFLKLARVGKLLALAATRSKIAREAEADVRRARQEHEAANSAEPRDAIQIQRTHELLQATTKQAESTRLEAEETERAARAGVKDAELRSLRHPAFMSDFEEGRLPEPFVIVAGGTDPLVQEKMEAYGGLLASAFEGFQGTAISGGTCAGIPGLVGDLSQREPGLTAIAYLPGNLPADAPRDVRYDRHYRTSGEIFSALEPLQNWIDLITASVPPSSVRVLGINGGPIAALEYALAMAVGATVGILEASGRAATDMLAEAGLWPAGQLVSLPADETTVRAFINPPRGSLDEPRVEEAAREVHAVYSEESMRQNAQGSLREWDDLPPDFRASSRQQAIYAIENLRSHGYEIVPIVGGKPVSDTILKKDIESMAEMEHGRWNVERLLAGWRFGAEKDETLRISPYLVPWDQLSEKIRDYDRQAVRNYPRVLRKAGLAVRRPGRSSRPGPKKAVQRPRKPR